MLKKYQTIELIDDLDGSLATVTVTFSVGGAHYAIDLSDENLVKFNEAIAPYVANGRRVTSRKKVRKSTSTPSARRKKTAQIRAWAIQKGSAQPNSYHRLRGRAPECGHSVVKSSPATSN